jgi:two-component system OmpR family response regulator
MRLRIYLVEDNPVIRDNLGASLVELVGAQVVGSATTEAAASAWLLAHPQDWDLAVVDLFLLQGNGLGVVSACRERRPGQKMVVFTNYATPVMRERCLAWGADAVFDKSNEIEAFMQYAIAASQARADAAREDAARPA